MAHLKSLVSMFPPDKREGKARSRLFVSGHMRCGSSESSGVLAHETDMHAP